MAHIRHSFVRSLSRAQLQHCRNVQRNIPSSSRVIFERTILLLYWIYQYGRSNLAVQVVYTPLGYPRSCQDLVNEIEQISVLSLTLALLLSNTLTKPFKRIERWLDEE